MYKVNGKPYIDTDQWLGDQLAELDKLKNAITLGLATTHWDELTYGHGVYDKDNYTDAAAQDELYRKGIHPDQAELDSILPGLNNDQTYTYLKMRYKTQGGGKRVTLRTSDRYIDVNKPDMCKDTKNFVNFPFLRSWIKTLPMAGIGRVILFVQQEGMCTPIHSDLRHSRESKGYKAIFPPAHEFLWFGFDKRLFMVDEDTQERFPVTSKSAWFNSFDLHGSEPDVYTKFSLRVDGQFTEEFRAKIYGSQ